MFESLTDSPEMLIGYWRRASQEAEQETKEQHAYVAKDGQVRTQRTLVIVNHGGEAFFKVIHVQIIIIFLKRAAKLARLNCNTLDMSIDSKIVVKLTVQVTWGPTDMF